MIRLIQPQSDHHWRNARQLVEEYAASLDVDLAFQCFGHEIEHLASEYAAPAGAFLLAEEDGAFLGCVGLRRFEDGVGEMKRLYVRPAARGRRVGRLLAKGIVAEARKLGYARLLLDTLPSMKEAQSLYLSLDFKPTAPYRFNPVPGTTYLALDLREQQRKSVKVFLRPATAADIESIKACVDAAYGPYVERIGVKPGPMLEDYSKIVREHHVIVAEVDGALAGVLVLAVTAEGFLLENVAVLSKGRGIGKTLLQHAEAEARRQGFRSIYLYTHEKMTENQLLYSRIGYVEYDRRVEDGLTRVFMRKTFNRLA